MEESKDRRKSRIKMPGSDKNGLTGGGDGVSRAREKHRAGEESTKACLVYTNLRCGGLGDPRASTLGRR